MRVEELRIGNLVFHLYKNEYYKISEGYDIDCGYNYEPIELTEEILLSIKGINKKIVDNKGLELTIYTINNIELLFTFGILRNIKFMNNKVIIYTAFRDFKLHDLQNLYFVLNGKELGINL